MRLPPLHRVRHHARRWRARRIARGRWPSPRWWPSAPARRGRGTSGASLRPAPGSTPGRAAWVVRVGADEVEPAARGGAVVDLHRGARVGLDRPRQRHPQGARVVGEGGALPSTVTALTSSVDRVEVEGADPRTARTRVLQRPATVCAAKSSSSVDAPRARAAPAGRRRSARWRSRRRRGGARRRGESASDSRIYRRCAPGGPKSGLSSGEDGVHATCHHPSPSTPGVLSDGSGVPGAVGGTRIAVSGR